VAVMILVRGTQTQFDYLVVLQKNVIVVNKLHLFNQKYNKNSNIAITQVFSFKKLLFLYV